MKHLKNISFKGLVMSLIGGLVVFSLAFTFPGGAAVVVVPTPSPRVAPTPASKTRDYSALTQAYQHEQSLLATQQANVSKAGGATSKIQDLISKAQAKGLDTSALASALATFQAQLATAQGDDSTAGSILSAHNGFDGSGNVTDPTAAAQTVKDAHQSLLDAHNTLTQATKDLSTAVQAWEEANKDKLQSQDLAKDYQNEQKWLAIQQDVLGKANGAVTNVQDLISKAQAQGLDTSALSSALATFQTQITNAQASHTTAEGILSAHNGFDGSGNVTDPTAATQTVNDAHQSLLDAHNTLVQATADLMKAVDQWRDQNHLPTPTPSSSGS
jgi:hypothetical protein